MLPRPLTLSMPLCYGYALLVTAAAVLLRWALDPWLGDQVPFITLFAAVALLAWQIGPGPAAASTVGGLLGMHLFVLDQNHRLAVGQPALLLLHGVYLLGCLVIVALAYQSRRRYAGVEQAVHRLRANENGLRQILDAVPLLIAQVGADLRYRFNNAAYERWFGMPAGAMRGKHVGEVVGPEALAKLAVPLQRVLAGETQQLRAEMEYQGAGRRQVSITMIPQRENQQVTGYFVVVEDLSERQRGEMARAQLAAIFESADDAVISKRLDGTVTSWNGSAERLFGWSAAEMVGQPIERIVPPERRGEEQELLRRLSLGEHMSHFETERLSRDGRRIPLSMAVSPIRDEAGSIVGASNISRDISERRLSEARLAAADRRKDEFLAMLAHELRNPLAPILNAAQFMAQHGGLPEALQPARTIIERQASHMRRLVDDLLDMSRINRGQIALKQQDLELTALLGLVIDAWQPQAQSGGVTLAWGRQAGLAWVHADDTRLSQVFGNLIGNAIKYTPPGGRVTVHTEFVADRVEIRVVDTGIGLSAGHLESVFEMFAQVDTTLERSQSGLGIGLTLARQLVALHGGSVHAESAGPNQGTTLVVSLPRIAAPAFVRAAPADHDSGAPALRQPLKILLAEDNADVAHSLTMMLELAGYQVERAGDGAAAVASASRVRPDVALLDIGMPLLNGYEAAQRIRALPGGADIRLVALTGWGQEEDRRRAREAGFDAHCTKPVDFAHLRTLIDLGSRAG